MQRAELRQYEIAYDQYETDNKFIARQLETHLKERFNVLLSAVEYEIIDGHLVRPGQSEPFINSIRRGRDILRRFGKTPEDFAREDAEVEEFEKIDPLFSNPQTRTGTMVLAASLNGRLDADGNLKPESESKYLHNFHDIFTLREESGKRYVELRRYSSGLTGREYARRLPGLDPENPPTSAEFIANPIVIESTGISADDIHRMLHKEHEYMTEENFSEIWIAVQPFVLRYLAHKDARSFNAVLNFADEVWENKKRKNEGQRYRDYSSGFYPSQVEINFYENKEVRQVATACPGKAGADIINSPFSASEFGLKIGRDESGCRCEIKSDNHYHCPGCNQKYADETDKSPENRTKKCSCGFEFGC